MLHIILLILKIIGIILLCVIGIILALIVLILFYPICYKAEGAYEAKPEARVKVSWLLRAVYFRMDYRKDQLAYTLRIFGYPLLSSEKKKRPDSGRRHKQKSAPKPETPSEPETPAETSPPPETPKIEIKEERTTESSEKPDSASSSRNERKEPKREEKRSKHGRGKDAGLKDKIHTARERGRGKSKKDKKDSILTFLRSDLFHEAFASVKKELLTILKHIRPRKFIVHARYGMDDPSVTGRIFGGVCALIPFLPGDINIYPDFENKCLEGDLYARGHIITASLLAPIWRLYRDKNVRKCYHKLMK